jgi:hypothetical protein
MADVEEKLYCLLSAAVTAPSEKSKAATSAAAFAIEREKLLVRCIESLAARIAVCAGRWRDRNRTLKLEVEQLLGS